MPDVTFVVAGALETRTGGSIYNRRIVGSLRRLGWTVDVHELDESFPRATDDALEHASELLSSLPRGIIAVVDGLAYGAMPHVVARAATRLQLMPIVHLPLAAAIGLDARDTGLFAQSERQALAHAKRVIVTGAHTLSLMRQLGLSHGDVALVEPGADAAPLATGSGSPQVQLLCVAALTPGKGHELLIDALARLPHRGWHLVCAGSLTRHPETTARVRAAISHAHLDEHVSLVGELDDEQLAQVYNSADVMVLASLRETYGMAVAEALARGLPVVATGTGATADLVGDVAGLVVPPGDCGALTEAIVRVISDADLRMQFAHGARRMRARLRSWDEAARQFALALTA